MSSFLGVDTHFQFIKGKVVPCTFSRYPNLKQQLVKLNLYHSFILHVLEDFRRKNIVVLWNEDILFFLEQYINKKYTFFFSE